MNYYGVKDLVEGIRTVRRNTIRIAEDIPEDKYGFRPAPDCRNVAETLVHITTAARFQHRIHALERRTTLAGIDFAAVMSEFKAEEKRARTKSELLELLRSEGDKTAQWLEGVSEEFLAERVAMPPGRSPESKSRFEMILGIKEHEMHHRGQLMVVERMLGIVPHLTKERESRVAEAQAGRAK